MLFNSAKFLIFYAIVYALYVCIRDFRRQNAMLLIASYVFYGAWDWRFLFLIIGATLADFFFARRIDAASTPSRRKAWLTCSICMNIGLLAFFKYFNFGVQSMRALLSAFGVHAHLTTLNIILPVGISFYTFQSISYTVNVYRRAGSPAQNLLDFATYIAFFPQLVAGPIEQSTHLLPQMQRPRVVTAEDIRIGLMWVIMGYAKKVVFADTLAPLVDQVFARPEAVTGITAAVSIVAFSVQIYGDFAGYTFIARGVARFLGVHLMENFHMPYLATDPQDFWRRWHISLSLWLRNFLYFSLGGNRLSKRRTYVNLMTTMLLGGLWHGANWTFVLWGGYHGMLLCVCHYFDRAVRNPSPVLLRRVLRVSGTFILTLFGWLLFRSPSVDVVVRMLRNIALNFRWDSETTFLAIPTFSMLTVLLCYHSWQERSGDVLILLRANRWVRQGIYAFLLVLIVAVGFRPVPFMYFQF